MTAAELLAAYAKGGRDFAGATLYGATLSRANLSRANLERANLYGANLEGANLYGATLEGATLEGANLYGANLPDFSIVPDAGAFRAWKKLQDNLLCELEIPEDAPRTSSLVGRKCRAAWAAVRGIHDDKGQPQERGISLHDGTPYRVGEMVVADDWDDDIRVECAPGIHFFITMKEAREY